MNENMENLIFDLEDLKICEEITKNHMVGKTGGPRAVKQEEYGETSTARYEAEIDPRRYVNAKVDFKTTKEKMYRDQFKPVLRESNPMKIAGSYLNLDCELDVRRAINEWSTNMIAHFNYNRSNTDNKNRTEYLLATFKGNVFNWYRGLEETTKGIWKDSIEAGFGISIIEGINRVATRIYREFAGEDWVNESTKARLEEIEDAKNRMEHLQICNMCYLNEYCCEYSKYYYMMFGSGADNNYYKEVFIRKLPPPWNSYFQNKIKEKQLGRNEEGYTLGFIIRTIKDE